MAGGGGGLGVVTALHLNFSLSHLLCTNGWGAWCGWRGGHAYIPVVNDIISVFQT